MDHTNVDIAKFLCIPLYGCFVHTFVYLKPVCLISHKARWIQNSLFSTTEYDVTSHRSAQTLRFVYLPRDSNLTQPLAEHALFSKRDTSLLVLLLFLFSVYYSFPLDSGHNWIIFSNKLWPMLLRLKIMFHFHVHIDHKAPTKVHVSDTKKC